MADNAGVSPTLDSCEYKDGWNAWACTNKNLGVLVAIGDDDDWEDRNVSPVYIKNA